MHVFERLVVTMKKPWVMCLMISLIVVCFFYVDQRLAFFFNAFHEKIRLLKWFSMLGLNIIYLAGFLAAAFFFRYIRQNPLWEERCWFLWLSLLFTNGICTILKVSLGRARPSLWLNEQLYGFYGWHLKADFWSFPSGHATTIMTIAFSLCILFPRYAYRYIALGLLVVLSRVLLVHHYLSDVISAVYLVLLEMGVLLWFVQKKAWFQTALARHDSRQYNVLFDIQKQKSCGLSTDSSDTNAH